LIWLQYKQFYKLINVTVYMDSTTYQELYWKIVLILPKIFLLKATDKILCSFIPQLGTINTSSLDYFIRYHGPEEFSGSQTLIINCFFIFSSKTVFSSNFLITWFGHERHNNIIIAGFINSEFETFLITWRTTVPNY